MKVMLSGAMPSIRISFRRASACSHFDDFSHAEIAALYLQRRRYDGQQQQGRQSSSQRSSQGRQRSHEESCVRDEVRSDARLFHLIEYAECALPLPASLARGDHGAIRHLQ